MTRWVEDAALIYHVISAQNHPLPHLTYSHLQGVRIGVPTGLIEVAKTRNGSDWPHQFREALSALKRCGAILVIAQHYPHAQLMAQATHFTAFVAGDLKHDLNNYLSRLTGYVFMIVDCLTRLNFLPSDLKIAPAHSKNS